MTTPYTDKQLTCKCGKPFTWTLGEQRFLHKLKDSGKIDEVKEPVRCGECRKEKKLRYKN